MAQHNEQQRQLATGMPMGFPAMPPFGGMPGLPFSPPYGSQVPPFNGQRVCVAARRHDLTLQTAVRPPAVAANSAAAHHARATANLAALADADLAEQLVAATDSSSSSVAEPSQLAVGPR